MEIMFHRGPPGDSEKTRSIIVKITRIKGKAVQGLEMAFESSFLLIADSDKLSAAQDLRSPRPDPLDPVSPRIFGAFLDRVNS